MTTNPFWAAAEDALKGDRVRVVSEQGTYRGILTMFHYQEYAVVLRDVTRPDGETTPAALVADPQVIAHAPAAASREVASVDIDSIAAQPGNVREYESLNFATFVRQVRQDGGVTNLPLVRPREDASEAAYEIVSGHRRVEALKRAGIEAHPVEVEELSDWEATSRFIDEHFPVTSAELAECPDQTTGWYPPALMRASYQELRAAWERERLWSHPAIAVNGAIIEAAEGAAPDVYEVLTSDAGERETTDGDDGDDVPAEVTRIASEVAAETDADEAQVREDLLRLRAKGEVPVAAARSALERKYSGE